MRYLVLFSSKLPHKNMVVEGVFEFFYEAEAYAESLLSGYRLAFREGVVVSIVLVESWQETGPPLP